MKEIPLSRGYVALVDDADAARVLAGGPWHASRRGRQVYAQRHLPLAGDRRTTQQLHTFLTDWPLVDHANGNGLDNRRVNLRSATVSQNNANAQLRTDSTSGRKGVTWHRPRRRWQAQIQAAGRKRHLGYFGSVDEAAQAYDTAARELFGEYARVNFPNTEAPAA